jgi:glycerophosphoryl diester phosphodiesterase
MKKSILFISLTLLFISCSKEDFTIQNLNNNEITVLGHGGMGIGQTYPINSYESILKCLNTGAQGTELDVQLTKDSILVAFHGKDLSDNTNLSGSIHDFTWDEIKDAHYTATPYLHYNILSLDQLFSSLDNLQDYLFTFDCKLYTNNDPISYQIDYIYALEQILNKYRIEDNIYLESQDTDFLGRLKSTNQNFKLFIYPSSFDEGLRIAKDMDLYGITISTEDITKEEMKEAHDNNLFVAIWNTHSKKKNLDAIDKNPDFIQTDRVEHLVKTLK